jgi:hypothetical protein
MLPLAREIHDLIAVEARAALDSGWAELQLDDGDVGPTIHLEPIKMEAAALGVYFDSEELVICTPGRKGLSCEFFSQDRDEIKERVRALAAAVIAGKYVERARKNTTELVGEWPGPEGMEQAKRAPLLASGTGRWQATTYEPY